MEWVEAGYISYMQTDIDIHIHIHGGMDGWMKGGQIDTWID